MSLLSKALPFLLDTFSKKNLNATTVIAPVPAILAQGQIFADPEYQMYYEGLCYLAAIILFLYRKKTA